RRAPATPQATTPETTRPTQKTEAAETPRPVGTQLSFVEISPSIGRISIGSNPPLSIRSHLSLRVPPDFPAYFEPSVFLSFYNGLNNNNGTIWHIDGGLRYDFAINNSALVPFLKAAIGPSLASNSNIVQSTGEKIPDSYLNAFFGGGVKIL